LRRALGLVGATPLHHTPLAVQARHIALSATILLYEHGDPALLPVAPWEALLAHAELHAALVEHLAAAAAGRSSHHLLPAPPAWATTLVRDHAALAAGWPALLRLLQQALEQTLWLGDLRLMLGQLGTAALARGVRPLLLLEDVTAFRLLGDRLLDYLLDLRSGHVDAVLGATTGFEQTRLAHASLAGDLTHVHQRLCARLLLTDEQGRTYGLDEDLVALAHGYLQALRTLHGGLPQLSAYDASFGPGLYPFTPTLLQRAFLALHEEGNPRQTPRLFLEHVLAAALLAAEPPPLVFDRSPYLRPPPALFRSAAVADANLRALLRWYGTVGDDAVTLDPRIATALGVAVPAELLHGNEIRVPRGYVAPVVASAAPSAPNWQQELHELQAWLEHGQPYPSRETLKRGVERLIFTLGDPRSLASPAALALSRAELVYARGDERLPIALAPSSGDQPVTRASPKVLVRGLPQERPILEELVYLALSGGELTQVCHNLAITLAWAQQQIDTYQADLQRLLREQLGGLSLANLILGAWHMLAALRNDPPDGPPNLQPAAQPLPSPWSSSDHAACATAGQALMQQHEVWRRLFIGMFTLRDTLLDHERLAAAHQHFAADAVVAQIAALPLAKLRTLPFRVKPSGERLYTLLVPLQRYASALCQADTAAYLQHDRSDLDARLGHLAAQQPLDQHELQQQLSALRWHCGNVGIVWRHGWDEAFTTLSNLSATTLTALQQATSIVQQQASASEPSDIWAYQRLRHALQPILNHPYWPALATIEQISDELLRSARQRYRGHGKHLSATPAYRALLQRIRAVTITING
ncbi:hypothetical protein CJ255_21540, partial [Candidatus Viridilinea mediisalina]